MRTRPPHPLYVEMTRSGVDLTYAVHGVLDLAGLRVSLAVVDPTREEPETAEPATLFHTRVSLDSLQAREKYAAEANARANGSLILANVHPDDLLALIPTVRAWAVPGANGREPEPSGKPIIDVADKDLERSSARAWAAVLAVNEPPRLFVYGGNVSRIERDPDTAAPVPRPLNPARLRYHVARAATFIDAGEPAAPPQDVVLDMLAEPEPPLPLLRGITETPSFAPDGSLPEGPGYHAAAGVVYAPLPGFVVPRLPDHPTETQLEAARELIAFEVLGEFPFTSDAAKAHAFALAVLPMARFLIAGPTPLHLIGKPQPGTGGTLLADVLAMIATGRPAAAMTIGASEDETRKHITSALLDSPAHIFIDNLGRRLDSSSLAAVLTTGRWQDRILGSSTVVRLAVRCAWVCAANNPKLSSELTRRSISLRLDAGVEKPWEREGFRHPDLPGWVMAHRGELVAALLTLVRGWLVAGRPPPTQIAKPLGSFPQWTAVIGGILEHAGVVGLLDNMHELYRDADAEGQEVRDFLLGWWERHGGKAVPLASLFTIASGENSTLDLSAKSEQGQRVRLGRLLASIEGRKYRLGADLFVTVDRATQAAHGGGVLWTLVPDDLGIGESGGECGGESPPTDSPSDSA